jgi:UDPglucose--hexose-1-phosphate uridylyltransferase
LVTRKLSSLLSDGREIIYFDDANSTLSAERNTDLREAQPRPPIAQMRLDSLTGEWISFATTRNNRAHLPPVAQCPLCPSTKENLSEIPDLFDVVVFENKNPSFATKPHSDQATSAVSTLEIGATLESIGRCEVVVFSSQHEGTLANQSLARIRTIIDVWADRTLELSKLQGVRQVFPFENRGEAIGVTLHHPHGQIYAYPYITPRTQKLVKAVEQHEGDLFQETLEFEEKSNRVLISGEHFVAYVPFAARWPIEIHLLPRRHVQNIAQLSDQERDELAEIYSRLLKSLDKIYDSPTPYISAWHQAPLVKGGEAVRLQLQITSPRRATDKLKFLAGSESAMGAFIADVFPESTAQMLRNAL